jgi:hypothetical protein
MRAKLRVSALLQALEQLCPITQGKMLPSLKHVRVLVGTETVQLQATDLSVALTRILPAEDTEPGEASVPAKGFSKIPASLAEDKHFSTVTLSSTPGMPGEGEAEPIFDDVCVDLVTGQLHFVVPRFQDLPAIPEAEREVCRMSRETFQETIGRVALLGDEDDPPPLNAVLLSPSVEGIHIVGANPFMTARRIWLPSPMDDIAEPLLLPRASCRRFLKLVPDFEDVRLRVDTEKRILTLAGDDFRFTQRLVEGKYPDSMAIIDAITGQGWECAILCSRAEVQRGVEVLLQLHPTVDELTCHIQPDQGTMTLTGASENTRGSWTVPVRQHTSAQERRFFLNGKLLLEGLQVFQAIDTVTLAYHPYRPGVTPDRTHCIRLSLPVGEWLAARGIQTDEDLSVSIMLLTGSARKSSGDEIQLGGEDGRSLRTAAGPCPTPA